MDIRFPVLGTEGKNVGKPKCFVIEFTSTSECVTRTTKLQIVIL